MPDRPLPLILRHLRQLTGGPDSSELSDAQLLERWACRRDEAAFELLLWRHGPMVFGVCRRLLAREADAEDAFQATFLALVRRAGSISRREALAGWLYRVAYRAAIRVRQRMARQPPVESRLLEQLPSGTEADAGQHDWLAILDEELQRLPERYRVTFILCHLENKTHKETARELDCPTGTVASRVSRAREILRRRLARRGMSLAVGLATAGLTAEGSAAPLPHALIGTTLRVAVLSAAGRTAGCGIVSDEVTAITEGVLRDMTMTKVKYVTALLLAGLAAGAGALVYQGTAGEQPGPDQAAPRVVRIVEEPAADLGPEHFSRVRLQEAEEQLLSVHSELRRKKVSLNVLLRQEPKLDTQRVSPDLLRRQVEGDDEVRRLARRRTDLEKTIDQLRSTISGKSPVLDRTVSELKSVEEALVNCRAEAEERAMMAIREEARAAWQAKVDKLQDEIASLKELETTLTEEVEQLAKQVRHTRVSSEDRLRALEKEVRDLMAEVAELRKRK